MAIAKKGLRKITVNNEIYFYKISEPLIQSDFTYNPDVSLDPEFMKYAVYYGLGKTAVSTINVSVFSEIPNSKLLVKIYTPLVDSFMDYEQFLTVTPKLVADLIKKASSMGWLTQFTSHLHLTFHHKNIKIRQPTIEQLEFEPKEDIAKNRFKLRGRHGDIERGMLLLDKALEK